MVHMHLGNLAAQAGIGKDSVQVWLATQGGKGWQEIVVSQIPDPDREGGLGNRRNTRVRGIPPPFRVLRELLTRGMGGGVTGPGDPKIRRTHFGMFTISSNYHS